MFSGHGNRMGGCDLCWRFSFGLFHGLGFAGGLKEAMSGMPGVGLAAALIGFQFGGGDWASGGGVAVVWE